MDKGETRDDLFLMVNSRCNPGNPRGKMKYKLCLTAVGLTVPRNQPTGITIIMTVTAKGS